MEIEFVAAAHAAQELMGLRERSIPVAKPMVMHKNNQTATTYGWSESSSDKAKLIDVAYKLRRPPKASSRRQMRVITRHRDGRKQDHGVVHTGKLCKLSTLGSSECGEDKQAAQSRNATTSRVYRSAKSRNRQVSTG
ncbi:unnamed protein product [Phytophthora fragariaefolia]|uniref:Unnamed protein product n=1 Tax=Phytophthora fragariaefolia TaxID=1490495 RepID=A0A9W6XVM6_9STRA|nr:unnamed protein product [Phytophthora fragariaefolia]